MKKQSYCLAFLPLLWCSITFASDIAREIRSGDTGNFFEIFGSGGCGRGSRISNDKHIAEDCGFGLGLGWEYHWKGFFTEAIDNSYSGLNFGYNLYQNDSWTLDFIAMGINGRVSDKDGLTPDMTEEQRNLHLRNRDTYTRNGGIRATHYWGNNIIQLRVEGDYSQNHGGAKASFLYGKTWQARNWNFHALGGLYWQSRARSEYLWGVSSEEATSDFEEYQAKSAINYSIELGATYPMSEHWISRTQLKAFRNDDSIAESPLSVNQVYGGISTSISYVF